MDITPKRLRPSENQRNLEKCRPVFDEIDRISDLPNEILCHILSFLPTKYAVGTTILSTKWKNLFPLIPNLKLYLDDSMLLHPKSVSRTDPVSFRNFVDRLLNITLQDVPSTYLLLLVCHNFHDGKCIANWINAALNLNVKRMDLRIRRLKNTSFFLNSLFGSDLISLNLLVDFPADVRQFRFSLPNLKVLCVKNMIFGVVNVLLESCPVLQYLLLYNSLCYSGEKLRICSPTLKVLRIVNGVCPDGEFVIDAPELVELSHSGFLATHYSAKRFKSLLIARLDLDQNVGQHSNETYGKAVELLKVCSDAQKLCLSEKFVSILHHYPYPLPLFKKLVALEIETMDAHGWELLPRLIDCAPNLRKLSLQAGFDNESYESFKASLKEPLSVRLTQRSDKCFRLQIRRKV